MHERDSLSLNGLPLLGRELRDDSQQLLDVGKHRRRPLGGSEGHHRGGGEDGSGREAGERADGEHGEGVERRDDGVGNRPDPERVSAAEETSPTFQIIFTR